jgi:4a-hydroxytetrahydrobiopterin dehydratase
MALVGEHCQPVAKGTAPLGVSDRRALLGEVPRWRLDGERLVRDLEFPDFRAALTFLARVGEVAEAEQHHPDLHLTRYRHVRVETTTHVAHGLTRNDFVLAARLERLLEAPA